MKAFLRSRFDDSRTELTRVYDDWPWDGGEFFVCVESFGPVGVVRARSWEEAYGICEDYIFDDADISDQYIWTDDTRGTETPELEEGYGYRPNGTPTEFGLKSPIYSFDLNCSRLETIETYNRAYSDTFGRIEVEINEPDETE